VKSDGAISSLDDGDYSDMMDAGFEMEEVEDYNEDALDEYDQVCTHRISSHHHDLIVICTVLLIYATYRTSSYYSHLILERWGLRCGERRRSRLFRARCEHAEPMPRNQSRRGDIYLLNYVLHIVYPRV
jgi:hypothetical protein